MRPPLSGLLLGLAAAGGAAAGNADPNMNTPRYYLSETPGSDAANDKFPTRFADYPRPVSHFDVYSPPISQLYSQVFWKGLPPVDLPADVVARFAGKGMAVVGFEMDQVRKTPAGDVSVPINAIYNHHFESVMIGAGSKFELVQFDGPNDPRIKALEAEMGGHGIPSHEEHWMVVPADDGAEGATPSAPPPPSGLPSKQSFGGANGGEYRLSFHGYAPGYVQVIESPTQFQITPMQIDTFNRDKMNLTGPTKFVPGPLPRAALSPTKGPDAIYSGLLECPLTTRVSRILQSTYTIVGRDGDNDSKPCGANAAPISNAASCFAAAHEVIGKGAAFDTASKNDPAQPVGCSVTADPETPNLVHVLFNTHNVSSSASSEASPACGAGVVRVSGQAASLVTLAVDVLGGDSDEVTITMTGPTDVWYGAGFNAQAMKDAPWAIVVEPDNSTAAGVKISEYKLSDQGTDNVLLKPSVKLKSSTVDTAKRLRTVVLTRPLQGLTKDHFTFDVHDTALNGHFPFINALGSGPTFSYHKQHAPAFVALVPTTAADSGAVATGDCICAASAGTPFGQGKGQFQYVPTSQKADTGTGTTNFVNNCPPSPRGDLLYQKNPTCDARTYAGGQITCHHMWSLLDADQEIPWADQPVEYHLKFRFWVQPWNASYHTAVQRVTWGIASPVEYDIPQCKDGMPGCSRNPVDGSWMHTITGTYNGTGKIVAAHFHCRTFVFVCVCLFVLLVYHCFQTHGGYLFPLLFSHRRAGVPERGHVPLPEEPYRRRPGVRCWHGRAAVRRAPDLRRARKKPGQV